jgi:outer membrane biosynthesis protein TonB
MRYLILALFVWGCVGTPKNNRTFSGFDAIESPTKKEINQVVRSHMKEIRSCYREAKKQDPHLEGKLVLNWTIGENGKVIQAHIGQSSIVVPDLETCTLTKLQSWTFPAPMGKKTANASFPFVFKQKR